MKSLPSKTLLQLSLLPHTLFKIKIKVKTLYVPSNDGAPDDWEGDFVEYLLIEDITSEPIEGDEMNNELVQTEETAFEESKMEHHLSPPSSSSPLSPPTPPPSPPVSRLPQRSNRGKPAVRYGFHTNIVKEVSKYGEEGDAALVAELKNMYEKKVFFPVKRERLSPEEKRNIIPSLAFVKQKYNPDGSKTK